MSADDPTYASPSYRAAFACPKCGHADKTWCPCPPDEIDRLEALDPRDSVTDPAVAAVINRVAQDASTAAKNGKTPFELVDLQFVASMARQLGAGLDKAGRVPDGWRALDPADWLLSYRAAMLRHVVACDTPHAVDRETGESHYAAVAVNAMICCVFERMLAERTESIADDTQLRLPLEGAERPSKPRAVSDD